MWVRILLRMSLQSLKGLVKVLNYEPKIFLTWSWVSRIQMLSFFDILEEFRVLTTEEWNGINITKKHLGNLL